MPPKRKATAHEKGKGPVSGSSSRTRHVAEPPDDGGIPRFRTDEIEECYTKSWASKHCGWHKVADAPHAAYPTLVREFFANFNPDIDVPESSHRYKTWLRGQWIRFSPTMIDKGVSLFPTEEADPPAALLNARSVENSETKIAARRGGRVHAAPGHARR
ncbi:Uncharacterized protein Adt_35222 [Abeliophyllum distichum]|uniref:Transposase n=1 Tax=Abeliophyllum distichum TaxID=126358 RepID=A0ABD1QE40_9LAMI